MGGGTLTPYILITLRPLIEFLIDYKSQKLLWKVCVSVYV